MNQSKGNHRGEDRIQVNEWLTMGNGRYARHLDPVLTIDTRPEQVKRIAVQHPPSKMIVFTRPLLWKMAGYLLSELGST